MFTHQRNWFGIAWLTFGFVFLYIPIVFMVVYSFNDSKLMVVWTEASLRWYREVFNDTALLDALKLSLTIGFFAATGSVVMGTFIAYVMHKYHHFLGRGFFMAMASSPLVMPEIVIGLSLLLMFSALQKSLPFEFLAIDGVVKIWIAHTFLASAYATVVILSRFKELDPALEEAALDLGCTPSRVFFLVTLPNIFAALLAAWLLAFTLSFDDVVLAQFLGGPGSTTLPSAIFSKARLGIDGSVNVIATFIVLIVSCILVLSSLNIARQEKKRKREMQLAAQQ